jgi:hypothetical protein
VKLDIALRYVLVCLSVACCLSIVGQAPRHDVPEWWIGFIEIPRDDALRPAVLLCKVYHGSLSKLRPSASWEIHKIKLKLASAVLTVFCYISEKETIWNLSDIDQISWHAQSACQSNKSTPPEHTTHADRTSSMVAGLNWGNFKEACRGLSVRSGS